MDAAIVLAFFVGAVAVALVIASRDERKRRRQLERDHELIEIRRRANDALAATYATRPGGATPGRSNTSDGVCTVAVPAGL